MKYRILYFASLRDAAGRDAETVDSAHGDARLLYGELRQVHGFTLRQESLRLAVNGQFTGWDRALADGDEVAFLPPVSGG
ncbi:MAG TPA: MoaD/ThiS family protein [Rudaea sp.]|nr:MoaD/ThiS family protein [Rudaea sp.]